MKALIVLLSFSLLAFTAYPQCDYTVEKQNETTAGASDGGIRIVTSDSWQCGTFNQSLCQESQPPTTDHCTDCQTVTSQWPNITSGKHCLPSDFTGGATISGGQLVICGDLSLDYLNFNGGDLIVMGNLFVPSINMNNPSSNLYVYGTFNANYVTFNGTVHNNGVIHTTGDFNDNQATATVNNYGTIITDNSFNSNYRTNNYATIIATRDLKNNSGSTFNNYCTVQAGSSSMGEFHNNSTFNNYGIVHAYNRTIFNGGSSYTAGEVSYFETREITNFSGSITGSSSGKAYMKIENQYNFSGQNISGNICICGLNATQSQLDALGGKVTNDCTCLQDVELDITWENDGIALPIEELEATNLGQGVYQIDGTCNGCTITEVVIIGSDEPAELEGTVTTTNTSSFSICDGTATAHPSKGVPPYSYQWHTGSASQSIGGLCPGSYVMTITDAIDQEVIIGYTILGDDNEESCNLNFTYTNVTCYGDNDGTITIDEGSLNCGGADNPDGCHEPELPTQDYCATCQVIAPTSGNVSVNGQTVCLPDGFNGNVDLNSGTLVICGMATITNMNYNGGNCIVIGAVILPNINMNNSSSVFYNYGTVQAQNFTFNGTVYNNGPFTVDYDFNVGSTALIFVNKSTLTVNNSLNTNSAIENYGTINVVGGDLKVNGNAIVDNYCTINIGENSTGKLVLDRIFNNYGEVHSYNTTTINASANLNLHAHSLFHSNELNNLDGAVAGVDPESAQIVIDGTGHINAPMGITGNLCLCSDYLWNNEGHLIPSIVQNACNCHISTPNIFLTFGQQTINIEGTTFTGLQPGTYTLHSQCGECSWSQAITITEPDIPTIVKTASLVDEEDQCSGRASFAIEGGTIASILWEDGFDQTTRFNLCAGTYRVTITDGNGCEHLDSVIIDGDTPNKECHDYVIELDSDGVTCSNANNAWINLTVSGGNVANPNIEWNVATADPYHLTNLSPETYTVTVSDTTKCKSQTKSITIREYRELTITYQTTNVCAGAYTGTIDVNVLQGKAPYTYLWSGPNVGGFNSQDLERLGVGIYNLTVVDACGEVANASINVSEFDAPTITPHAYNIDPTQNCKSIAYFTITGGEVSSILWNDFSTQKTRRDLCQGTYQATITDGNGCPYPGSVTIDGNTPNNECPPYHIELDYGTVCCDAVDDGWIDLSVEGGRIGSPTISWNTPTSDNYHLRNLSVGTYSVTISDSPECPDTTVSVTITNYNPIEIDYTYSVERCPVRGAIDITVTRGQAPYTYLWNGPGIHNVTLQDLDNLDEGTYTLIVTDAQGKSASAIIPIKKPMAPDVIVHANLMDANDDCSGTASFELEGAKIVSVLWEDGTIATTRFGLCKDTYAVTITDHEGCTYDEEVEIGDNPVSECPPYIISAEHDAVDCHNSSSAWINLSVEGGRTANPTVSWNVSAPNPLALTGLAAGSYTVTVSDNTECPSQSTTVVINPHSPLSASYDVYRGCGIQNNASIDLKPAGGKQPYTYHWSGREVTGTTTQDLTNITPGNYTVSVTDMCGDLFSEVINIPTGVEFSIGIEDNIPSCNTKNTGQLSVQTFGAINPEYRWSNGASLPSIEKLASGNYWVDVTEEGTNCTMRATAVVGTINCDGNPCENFTVEPKNISGSSCGERTDGSVEIKVKGGKRYHTLEFSPSVKNKKSMAPGFYSVTATETINNQVCSASATFTIPEASLPHCDCEVDKFSLTPVDIDCHGESNGYIIINYDGSSGMDSYTFTWDKSVAMANQYETEANLPLGTYTLTIEDKYLDKCKEKISTIIDQPDEFTIEGLDGAICEGTVVVVNTNYVDVTWTGAGSIGINPNFYMISEPGDYNVTANDGCVGNSIDFTVTLADPEDCSNDDGGKSAFCHPQPKIIAEIEYDCENTYRRLAEQIADRQMKQQKEEMKRLFQLYYTEVCLNSAETMTMTKQENKGQTTLFYYDLAGNLVKTVPPKGVKAVTDQAGYQDKLASIADKRNKKGVEIPEHEMASMYTYNSFNNVIAQAIPDNEKIDEYNVDQDMLVQGLPDGLEIHNMQFNDEGKGVLSATLNGQPVLYYCDELGGEWHKTNTITIENLHSVDAPATNTVYACGVNGMVLKSTDNGATWTIMPTGLPHEFIFIDFSDANNGVLMASNGNYYTTTDGAVTWNYHSRVSLSSGYTVTSAALSASGQPYAVASNGKNGVVYTITNTDIWYKILDGNIPMNSIVDMQMDQNNNLVALDDKGMLFSFTGSKWNIVPTLAPMSQFKLCKNGMLYALATNQRLYKFDDVSSPGTSIYTGVLKFNASEDGNGIVAVRAGGIYYSRGYFFLQIPSNPSYPAAVNSIDVEYMDGKLIIVYTNADNQTIASYDTRTWNLISTVGDEVILTKSDLLIRNGNSTPYYKFNGSNMIYQGSETSSFPYETLNGILLWNPNSKLVSKFENPDEVLETLDFSSITGIQATPEFGSYYINTDGKIMKLTEVGNAKSMQDFSKSMAAPHLNDIAITSDGSIGVCGILGFAAHISPDTIQFAKTFGIYEFTAIEQDTYLNGAYYYRCAGMGQFTASFSEFTTAFVYNSTASYTINSLHNTSGVWDYTATNGHLSGEQVGTNEAFNDMAILNNQKFAVGTNGAMFRNLNNAGWEETGTVQVQDIRNIQAIGTRFYALGTNGEILVSTNNGRNWLQPATSGLHNFQTFVFADELNGMAATTSGELLYTTNGGGSFLSAQELSHDVNGQPQYASLAPQDVNNLMMVRNSSFALCDAGRILYSADNGRNWELVDIPGVTENLYAISPNGMGSKYIIGGSQGAVYTCIGTRSSNNAFTMAIDSYIPIASVGNPVNETVDYLVTAGQLYAKTIEGSVYKKAKENDTWGEFEGGTGTNYNGFVNLTQNKFIIMGNNTTATHIEDEQDMYATRFWYDKLGRILASQNAEQAADNDSYSYLIYDEHGRVVEAGKLISAEDINKYVNHRHAWMFNMNKFNEWLATGNKREVAVTKYDESFKYSHRPTFSQDNLRNRVSATLYYPAYTGEKTSSYAHGTLYSYDIHGNVKSLLQVSKRLNNALLQKQIDYEYDLISGNVKKISYQDKNPDAFYHKYEYDADNRITSVFTSRDGWNWQRDAHYKFYRHGPLAQTNVGEGGLQVIDYAYTLQGWIKGVNTVDMVNGSSNTIMDGSRMKDAYAYKLGYHTGDYTPIGLSSYNEASPQFNSEDRSLYNGNIAWMATKNAHYEEPIAMTYKYDQLNRITGAMSNSISDNAWQADNTFAASYSYDKNGNITNLDRLYNNEFMDKFEYHYDAGMNRLNHVEDKGDQYVPTQTEDLKAGQTTDNYQYDKIGNLIHDEQGQLENIAWTNTGKVESVTFSDGKKLVFEYDGTGNRTKKKVFYNDELETVEIYFRDATGNIMSIDTYNPSDVVVKQEYSIHGATRLGVYTSNSQVSNNAHYKGLKNYELTNHLGNVLAVVSDRLNEAGEPELITAMDYLPFGMLMDGRYYDKFLSSDDEGSYRFGFNGHEQENGIYGKGVAYDFGARMYDSRIGRWMSIDPLYKDYPSISPYAFVANSPMQYIDPDGKRIILGGTESDRKETLKYLQQLTNDKLSYDDEGILVISHGGANKGKDLSLGTELIQEISYKVGPKTMTIFIDNTGNKQYDVNTKKASTTGSDAKVYFDPNQNYQLPTMDLKNTEVINKSVPSKIVLAHELIHGLRAMKGDAIPLNKKTWHSYFHDGHGKFIREEASDEELETVGISKFVGYKYSENAIREEHGLNQRVGYEIQVP